MSGYLSAREIARLWKLPEASVRRHASIDKWARTRDRKRPVFYRRTDVEKTMKRIGRTTEDPLLDN